MEETEGRGEYAVKLGERLRNVRQQQGLSLHDVETMSAGQLKASVVGAYERGERAISVTRLRSMADFFGVPISQLLPGDSRFEPAAPAGSGLCIDLTRLGSADAMPTGGTDVKVIERYVAAIQVRRGDFNGRMLTVRSGDIEALAAVLDVAPETLRDELLTAGMATETT